PSATATHHHLRNLNSGKIQVSIGATTILPRGEVETALILEHLNAHQPFYLTVFNDAATSAFFDELVTFVSGRLLPPYEGVRTEAEQDCLTVLGGGLVWTAVHWLRQGATRETPAVMAKRMAKTAATILDAFGLTVGFAQADSE
ncbi:TetR-like C-terminal domain-containing protein, partial [Burkholderia contaminans]|uniref:TetR-like C-terminal domain-containing protein n=1 Tax=Burkholderia contaminans TaxID=488447 RepID=UPI001FC85D95